MVVTRNLVDNNNIRLKEHKFIYWCQDRVTDDYRSISTGTTFK